VVPAVLLIALVILALIANAAADYLATNRTELGLPAIQLPTVWSWEVAHVRQQGSPAMERDAATDPS
jgi:hypothetical protein